ncbi:MAG TPA: class I SAM-dependent methyltransferase [Stellaceae bacterium]|nr:class I SAM-dependent methyltransferase [Stellaceae bacterium]
MSARILPGIDRGQPIDWGSASADYAQYRPGPPDQLFAALEAFGIGLPGQRILDLGTGTGVVARALAKRGAIVSGIDVSRAQIEEAQQLAARDGLTIDFRVAPAEEPPFGERTFEVATANQCFLYFDRQRVIAELRRVLTPGGRLAISHFNWLPLSDPIAAASEALVLRFNPNWQAAGFDGNVGATPDWLPADVAVEAFLWFDADVPFTRESWRGRIRASHGIGASLSLTDVHAFDTQHSELLDRTTPPSFTVKHRVDARVLRFP